MSTLNTSPQPASNLQLDAAREAFRNLSKAALARCEAEIHGLYADEKELKAEVIKLLHEIKSRL